ncbi:MAG TPA: dihydropteroate synthase [Anaeromyxobacteraceae bacterium]
MPIGARTFDGPGPFLMGVVNTTPDSFSDGGQFLAADAAVAHAERLVAEGADLLDIGGESTRPGAAEVPAAVEASRVVPVIERLRAGGCAVPISVDTRKAEVARAALRAGADLVNDVSALSDPALREVVAEAGVPAVLMHMRGTPSDMASRAVYADVVGEVERELAAALARAVAAGVREELILLDPGLGFAKTAPHSLALLAALPRLARLGRPLVVGPSRKSFIGAISGAPVGERLPGTLAAVAACVLSGVEVIRVHDVAPARQAALVAFAIRAASAPAEER